MECHGNSTDHCCWVKGQVCAFLEENTVPGRRWACGLLRELGTWAAVHSDPRWRAAPVAGLFVDDWAGYGCGDWPQNLAGQSGCCYEAV